MTDSPQPGPKGTLKGRGSAPQAVLVIEDRDGKKQVMPFSGDEIVVGRGGQGNTVRLQERDVSRHHARFSRSNGTVWVEDLGSSNGTLVNGERIQGKRRIREGDLVQIGGYDIAVVGTAELTQGAVQPAPSEVEGLEAKAAEPPSEAARKVPPLPGENESVQPPDRAPRLRPAAPDYARGERDLEPTRRSGRAKALLAIGAASLLLGWAAGRLLRPVPHPAASTSAKETGR